MNMTHTEFHQHVDTQSHATTTIDIPLLEMVHTIKGSVAQWLMRGYNTAKIGSSNLSRTIPSVHSIFGDMELLPKSEISWGTELLSKSE